MIDNGFEVLKLARKKAVPLVRSKTRRKHYYNGLTVTFNNSNGKMKAPI